MWGAHLIKHGSAVQSTIALDSGESAYWALVRSSAHAPAVKAMLNDWRYEVECEIRIRCDSSAARGMSARQGLGKRYILMCASCGAKLRRIVAIGV